MASFQDQLIESLINDLKDIEEFDDGKVLRKECSLLVKRIQSAKKLFSEQEDIMDKLEVIEQNIRSLQRG